MPNTVYLRSFTARDDYDRHLYLPLESYITYCIYRYCAPDQMLLRLVPEYPKQDNAILCDTMLTEADYEQWDMFRTDTTKDFKNLGFVNRKDLPWQVASCVLPVVLYEDTTITGLCAVARHICKCRSSIPLPCEHPEGLLGFRKSCLQAPNETSVWTKFCEVDIVTSMKKITIEKLPEDLLRFENHLKKPVKVHNVYKLARDMKKNKELKIIQENKNDTQFKHNEISTTEERSEQTQSHGCESFRAEESHKGTLSQGNESLQNEKSNKGSLVQESKAFEIKKKNQETVLQTSRNFKTNGNQPKILENRLPKNRKWKSNAKKQLVIDSSTKVEELNIDHQFAEGPFLTLADLLLLPSYQILISMFQTPVFENVLPLTSKWLKKLAQLTQNLIPRLVTKTSSSYIENLLVPKIADLSLYKSDPKRHNPKKRLFTKEEDIEKALKQVERRADLDKHSLELNVTDNELKFPIVWDKIPSGANPLSGHLPDERKARKAEQLENLASAVQSLAKDGDLIVDFCSGSGHLGILLAHLLPKCKIVLLENKEQSLNRARTRVHEMGLSNVYFLQCNLDFFIGKFDIGVALHACGIASDLVLNKCLESNAKFVVCPCCYGSLHETDRLYYPRSLAIPPADYFCIGHAADQTHDGHPLTERGERCMRIIDSDRAHLARKYGYNVILTKLKPLSCTPKNNLLIGIPSLNDK